jgi:hypothetical protein
MGSENDDKGEASWLASSPSGAAGKRAVSQANGKFNFKEPETTEFSVKPSSGLGRHSSNGSLSRSTFVFSEPSDKNDANENDAGSTEIAAVPAKSLPSSFRASTAAAGSSTGAASSGSSSLTFGATGATTSAAPVVSASVLCDVKITRLKAQAQAKQENCAAETLWS